MVYRFRQLLWLALLITGSNAFYKYTSSYVFLNVRSEQTPKEGIDFCANYQQWRTDKEFPDSPDHTQEKFLRFEWWNDEQDNTDICKPLSAEFKFAQNAIIPANYRSDVRSLPQCNNRTGFNATDQRTILNEVNVMMAAGVKNALFLVKKGAENVYGLHTHNYLYSHFFNAEINDTKTIPVYYIYREKFEQEIKPLIKFTPIGREPARLAVYRPRTLWPIDPAVIVLWILAAVPILIGSLWAAYETRRKLALKLTNTTESQASLEAETDQTQRSGNLKRSQSDEIAQMNGWQHCTTVLFALVFVVVVLMLAFFFREYAVMAFNVLLVVLGAIAIHDCLYALLHFAIGDWEWEMPSLRQIFCCDRKGNLSTPSAIGQHNSSQSSPSEERRSGQIQQAERRDSNASTASLPITVPPQPHHSSSNISFFDQPIKLLSSLLFIFSLLITLAWFLHRDHYNAYFLLDTINVAVCIYAVKSSRIRSLRLITLLLIAMFAYDLFMVFGTRWLTPGGCSVMLQVVTGVECQKRAEQAQTGKPYQPIAPIDATNMPEKIPLLFYVPMLADPMRACYDVEVETEYKHVMLGLGDVIVPGYLIAFCFYVDVARRSRFYTYGSISLIGYTLGMASTFLALLLMQSGQPALIYLVPFTLIPIAVKAFLFDSSGTLTKMWRGIYLKVHFFQFHGDYMFEIREATPADASLIRSLIQELAEFEQVADGPKIDNTRLSVDIHAGTVYGLVAFSQEGTLAGHALYYLSSCSNYGQFLFVEDLYIRPTFRRQRLGTTLMQKLAEIAKQRQMTFIELNTLSSSAEAVEFYAALGSEDVTRKNKIKCWRLEQAFFESLMARKKVNDIKMTILMDEEDEIDKEKADILAQNFLCVQSDMLSRDEEQEKACISASALAKLFQSGQLGAVIAERDKRPVGMAIFHRKAYSSWTGQYMTVDRICVHPDLRVKIGTAIAAELAKIAFAAGFSRIGWSAHSGSLAEPFFVSVWNLHANQEIFSSPVKCSQSYRQRWLIGLPVEI